MLVQEVWRLKSERDDIGARFAAERFAHDLMLVSERTGISGKDELIYELGKRKAGTCQLQMQMQKVDERLVDMMVEFGVPLPAQPTAAERVPSPAQPTPAERVPLPAQPTAAERVPSPAQPTAAERVPASTAHCSRMPIRR